MSVVIYSDHIDTHVHLQAYLYDPTLVVGVAAIGGIAAVIGVSVMIAVVVVNKKRRTKEQTTVVSGDTKHAAALRLWLCSCLSRSEV